MMVLVLVGTFCHYLVRFVLKLRSYILMNYFLDWFNWVCWGLHYIILWKRSYSEDWLLSWLCGYSMKHLVIIWISKLILIIRAKVLMSCTCITGNNNLVVWRRLLAFLIAMRHFLRNKNLLVFIRSVTRSITRLIACN